MAVYNEIGIGRWNRFIQKITDIKGSPPARQLASEIVFQHPISHGRENRYLEGWDQFGLGATVANVVAQTSNVRLNNPIGSNVIAVIEKIIADAPATTTFNVQYGTPAANLNSLFTVIPMETRGRASSTLIASFNTGVPTTFSIIMQQSILANTPFKFVDDDSAEISVPPGAAIQLQCTTVNTAFNFSLRWRERFLEPSERF
jgi:hypothetical protein